MSAFSGPDFAFPNRLVRDRFFILFVVTTSFLWLGPKDVLRIAGALIFGNYVSTVFVTIAEICILVNQFQLSRRLGRDFAQERFKIDADSPDRVKGTISIVQVSASRLNSFFPFRVPDLGFGLSRITLQRYFLISPAVSPLRVFWLQPILAGIGEGLSRGLSAVVQHALQNPIVLGFITFYFLLVVALSIVGVVVGLRRKRRSLSRID